MIKKLPIGFALYKDDIELQFAIWNEIQEAIKQSVELGIAKDPPDPTIFAIEIMHSDRTESEGLRKI